MAEITNLEYWNNRATAAVQSLEQIGDSDSEFAILVLKSFQTSGCAVNLVNFEDAIMRCEVLLVEKEQINEQV